MPCAGYAYGLAQSDSADAVCIDMFPALAAWSVFHLGSRPSLKGAQRDNVGVPEGTRANPKSVYGDGEGPVGDGAPLRLKACGTKGAQIGFELCP